MTVERSTPGGCSLSVRDEGYDKMKRNPEFLVWKTRDRMTLCGVMENPVIEQF